jgi:hypothetical protein
MTGSGTAAWVAGNHLLVYTRVAGYPHLHCLPDDARNTAFNGLQRRLTAAACSRMHTWQEKLMLPAQAVFTELATTRMPANRNALTASHNMFNTFTYGDAKHTIQEHRSIHRLLLMQQPVHSDNQLYPTRYKSRVPGNITCMAASNACSEHAFISC